MRNAWLVKARQDNEPSRSAASLASGDEPDGPEIVRKIVVKQIGVRHVEIALHAPVGSPRIAYDEYVPAVVIADGHHRVTGGRILVGSRHRNRAALGVISR